MSSFTVVTLFLFSCAFMFGLGGLAYIVAQRRRDIENMSTVALSQVLNSASDLSLKVALLKEHSARYFLSLNQAGFSDLCALTNALLEITDSLNDLHHKASSRTSAEIVEVCAWLDEPTRMPPHTLLIPHETLLAVHNWKGLSTALLLRCAQAVNLSSQHNAVIGVQGDRRTRKDTVLAMREVLSCKQE